MDDNKSEHFREAMGNYPSGVAVVTTTNREGKPIGIAINSFISVSMDPLLVLWSISNKSSSYDIFKDSRQFAVHLLAEDQEELSTIFSRKNVDRFAQVKWSMSENELPIIKGAYAIFKCSTFKTVEVGDHTLIIGLVESIENHLKNPLLYHKRQAGPLPAVFHQS